MTDKRIVPEVVSLLLYPDRLYTALDVGCRPCPVPPRPGVYAWYFDEQPPDVDTTACHRVDDRYLLYVGISPKALALNGKPPSRSTLRQRIRTHYFGNAEGSTLRRTLGCLLSSKLGIALRRAAIRRPTTRRDHNACATPAGYYHHGRRGTGTWVCGPLPR
jgi:hypothetical protein